MCSRSHLYLPDLIDTDRINDAGIYRNRYLPFAVLGVNYTQTIEEGTMMNKDPQKTTSTAHDSELFTGLTDEYFEAVKGLDFGLSEEEDEALHQALWNF